MDIEKLSLILHATPENHTYQKAISENLKLPKVLLNMIKEYFGAYCPQTVNFQNKKRVYTLLSIAIAQKYSATLKARVVIQLLNAGADPLAKTNDPFEKRD